MAFNNSNFIVSVCVTTYNHINYIKKSLDSILKQKTNFEFEICIGEDESSDGTREICIQYEKKYPDKIKLFLRKRKDIIYIDGKPSGRLNGIKTLKKCKGKYIAICEGDDYWVDPYKLQNQVNFLENNPEYILIGSRVQILKDKKISDSHQPKEGREILPSELFQKNPFAASAILFRRINIKYPKFYNQYYAGDIMLYFILSKYGKLYFDNFLVGIYRSHRYGITKVIPSKNRSLSRIRMFIDVNKYFKMKYINQIVSVNSKIALNSIKNHYKDLTLGEFIFLIKIYLRGLI